jgi:lipoprotein LpqH
VKHGLLVAVGGAAIVVAGLSGCSSGDKSSSPSSASSESSSSASASASASASETASASATAAPGGTTVTIDGQDQQVNGTVVCASMGGNVNIAIGEATTGIAAVVSEGDSPTVQSVGLGNVNGVVLGYQQGTGQGEAKAEKTGNTYKISGSATGVDMANPMAPVTKPFELEITCP